MAHDSTAVLCTAGNQSSVLPLFPFIPATIPLPFLPRLFFPLRLCSSHFHFPSIPLPLFPFPSFPFASIPPVFAFSIFPSHVVFLPLLLFSIPLLSSPLLSIPLPMFIFPLPPPLVPPCLFTFSLPIPFLRAPPVSSFTYLIPST